MFGAKLSWCQIVRCQFVRVPNCPFLLSWCQIVRFYYLGAKLSVLLSRCQIVRCQIVQCQIVRCQIVLPPKKRTALFQTHNWEKGKFFQHVRVFAPECRWQCLEVLPFLKTFHPHQVKWHLGVQGHGVQPISHSLPLTIRY